LELLRHSGRLADLSKEQMPLSPEAAKKISEDLLERTRLGLIEGDFDTFAACFVLPHEVDTIDGRRMIRTPEEFRKMFNNIVRFFEETGVTELSRQCIEASFKDENTIGATHKSRVLKGEVLVQDPYPAYSILKCFDGHWKVTFSQYSILDKPAHNKALMD
jgi:hypothetical protein